MSDATTYYNRVRVEVTDGVADVRMVRGDKMNALDTAMFDALVVASAAVAERNDVRAVVLSGEGRSFCAGLDFGSFQAMAGDGPGLEIKKAEGEMAPPDRSGGETTHHAQQSVYGFTEMPVPVIAAIQGVALGGGIQLALGADIRVIAPTARMSVLEIRWGLIPDMTGTQRLVEIVGMDVAKELTFTGRMVEGEEAVAIGLATKVADDPYEAALEMARDIANKSPHAIRAAKRLFRQAVVVSEADGFAAERQEIGALIGSPNQGESVKAFFEKRPPNFTDV